MFYECDFTVNDILELDNMLLISIFKDGNIEYVKYKNGVLIKLSNKEFNSILEEKLQNIFKIFTFMKNEEKESVILKYMYKINKQLMKE